MAIAPCSIGVPELEIATDSTRAAQIEKSGPAKRAFEPTCGRWRGQTGRGFGNSVNRLCYQPPRRMRSPASTPCTECPGELQTSITFRIFWPLNTNGQSIAPVVLSDDSQRNA